MAPEVNDPRLRKDEGTYTEAADKFSLGVVIYFMLMLKMPWSDLNYMNAGYQFKMGQVEDE